MNYKFCTECGTKIEKHYRVCINCGKPFANIQVNYNPQKASKAMDGPTSPNSQEIKEEPVNNTRSTKQTSRRKKLTLMIGSILVALLLVIFVSGPH